MESTPFFCTRHGSACTTRIRERRGEVNKESGVGMKSIVADNFSKIIKEKCLKQCTVAQKAGYSKQQLTDMLKGRKRIKETDILRLASALDVDVSVLLKTEADSKQSDEASDKQREKERPDVRAFVKLLKIEDGYAVCDVRFKIVKPDEEQEVTDR